MLKRSKLVLSISLLVQSFTLFILFLFLCVKKKSIAAAFLAVSAMEGAAGAYLFRQVKEELEENDFDPSCYLDEDLIAEELDLDDTVLHHATGRDEEDVPAPRAEIALDDSAEEEEFKNH
ncbi:MAG: hypothetical protein IJF73_00150 [Clostridia bacterium]|nr:hypothetical protein [Clostridia bacterium]